MANWNKYIQKDITEMKMKEIASEDMNWIRLAKNYGGILS